MSLKIRKDMAKILWQPCGTIAQWRVHWGLRPAVKLKGGITWWSTNNHFGWFTVELRSSVC